jgi:dTDP-4-dehydrorhamnose reductase
MTTGATGGPLAIVGAGGVLGAKLVEQALQQLATTDRADGAGDCIYAFTHGTVPAIPAAHDERVRWQAVDIADDAAVTQALEQARPVRSSTARR